MNLSFEFERAPLYTFSFPFPAKLQVFLSSFLKSLWSYVSCRICFQCHVKFGCFCIRFMSALKGSKHIIISIWIGFAGFWSYCAPSTTSCNFVGVNYYHSLWQTKILLIFPIILWISNKNTINTQILNLHKTIISKNKRNKYNTNKQHSKQPEFTDFKCVKSKLWQSSCQIQDIQIYKIHFVQIISYFILPTC